MSLRPHEQRILAAVEQQLSRDDPALADLLARHPPTTARRDYSRPSAPTLTRRSAASKGLPILIVAAVVVALVVGGTQIALLAIAVVLLCAAHVLRWRGRRALFRRIRDLDTDA